MQKYKRCLCKMFIKDTKIWIRMFVASFCKWDISVRGIRFFLENIYAQAVYGCSIDFIYICYLWKEALPLIEILYDIYTIHAEWLYDIYHSFWMVAQTLSQQWTLQTRRYGKETIITVTVQITWCRCSIICFSCPYGCFDIDVDCWPFWMSRCCSTRRLVR